MQIEEVVEAVAEAASEVLRERPYVGGYNIVDATPPASPDEPEAHERALSGRLGIWLDRQQAVWSLEAHGVRVDVEYDQMGQGDPKLVRGKQRRIDLLLHFRGHHESNLLACEVKAGTGRPGEVDSTDREKLEGMTECPFSYTAGVLLHFPRNPKGRLYMATFQNGHQRGAISEIA